jgi:hypothetical protein
MNGSFLEVGLGPAQMQRRSAIRPSCQNVHGAASVIIVPLHTLGAMILCCGAARRRRHTQRLSNQVICEFTMCEL